MQPPLIDITWRKSNYISQRPCSQHFRNSNTAHTALHTHTPLVLPLTLLARQKRKTSQNSGALKQLKQYKVTVPFLFARNTFKGLNKNIASKRQEKTTIHKK